MKGEISYKANLEYGIGEEVTFRERLAYGVGDAGCNFVWSVVGMFLTLYYTDSVGISAGVVGTIMLLTRLFDGFSDLGMGIVIDRTHTRWGKARPWVLYSAPFMALGMILLFNVPMGLSENMKIMYVVITYMFLAVIVYTASNLSYSTLLSLVATKQEDRTSLSTVRFICTTVAVLFISYGTMPVVEKIGWGGMSVLFGIIAMGLLLITFFGTRERCSEEKENMENSVGVGKSVKLLFKNKYFLFASLLFIINYAAAGCSMGIAIYYAKDVLNNMGIFGTLTMAGMLPVLAGLFLFPTFANRFGKWKCLVGGYVLQIIGFGMIALMPTNITVVLLGLVIKGIGTIPHMAGMFALVADVVDYGEWKTGVRLDGLTYSAVSFGMKVGTGLGSAIVGWSLAIGKYDATAAVQSESAMTAIKAVYSYIPLALILVGMGILFMTNLDKIYPVIKKDLEARRLEG